MTQLVKKELSPEELINELEKRANSETALVIMSIGQWKTITDAYHSPLIENIASNIIEIFPQRDVETKELSFKSFARQFSV